MLEGMAVVKSNTAWLKKTEAKVKRTDGISVAV
jgi:hypothetical protein